LTNEDSDAILNIRDCTLRIEWVKEHYSRLRVHILPISRCGLALTGRTKEKKVLLFVVFYYNGQSGKPIKGEDFKKKSSPFLFEGLKGVHNGR